MIESGVDNDSGEGGDDCNEGDGVGELERNENELDNGKESGEGKDCEVIGDVHGVKGVCICEIWDGTRGSKQSRKLGNAGEGGCGGKEQASPTKGGIEDIAIGPGVIDDVGGQGADEEAEETGGINAGVEGCIKMPFKKN